MFKKKVDEENYAKKGTLDLKEFNFPEVNAVNRAFPTFKADPALLAEAKARGFYNGSTPYNQLFSDLFFSGGKIKFKKNVDETFRQKAWGYCKAFMGSYEPKHEEKESF